MSTARPKTETVQPVCLADVVIRTLRGKWAMQILLAFDEEEQGQVHFNHLKRAIPGISAKVLAMAAVIVTIALVIKGPSIVKRIISKI